jgi:hypothetical protein
MTLLILYNSPNQFSRHVTYSPQMYNHHHITTT